MSTTRGRRIAAVVRETVAGREPARRGRVDSRREKLLETAARLFAQKGFDATSMRDIANEAGMLSGSIYSHVRSKDELYLEIYRIGMRDSIDRVHLYASREVDPWERLVAATIAHLEMMLDPGSFSIASLQWPNGALSVHREIVAERDRYEKAFTSYIDGLSFAPDLDHRYLRLGILGAVNWAQRWYKPGGDSLNTIARHLLAPYANSLR